MQQVFIEEVAEINQSLILNKEVSHHLLTVLRMKQDEVLRIVDKKGRKYFATLQIQGKLAQVTFTEEILKSAERSVEVTLLMGLIKKEKWDLTLVKACELGVTRIVPFESKRTVVKNKEEREDRKLERWNKLALEAAQQCKRDKVPEIVSPLSLMEAVDQYRSELNFVAYEILGESSAYLRDVVEKKPMTVIIGPEGGFDESEIEELKKKGVRMITLGARILRAETAAMYVLSAIDALIEE